MQDQKLMDYFKFDEADLQANRRGQLSERQQKYLVREESWTRTWRMVGGGLLILIALIGVGAASVKIVDIDLGIRIGFGLIWTLVWGGIGVLVMRRAFSKFQVKLLKAQGSIDIFKKDLFSTSTDADGVKHTHQTTVHQILIGNLSFDITGNLEDIMLQGGNYAVYYTEGSSKEKEIVSAELISKAK